MNIGDKVKSTKDGKIGIIKSVVPITGPVNLQNEPRALKDKVAVKHFIVVVEDGTTFAGKEEDLRLVK